jgi:L-amino acid N-acyltransferase YncA
VPATDWTLRDATSEDAAACAAIYAPFVTGTVITFELEPPDEAELSRRLADAQRRHAWRVAEADGRVVGYAYAGPYKARPAYDWACETSIYLAPTAQGQGLGTRLYVDLLDRLAGRDLRVATSCVTLPNPASAAMHRSLGFDEVGVFRRIGWKHGAWHDVAWFSKALGPASRLPPR